MRPPYLNTWRLHSLINPQCRRNRRYNPTLLHDRQHYTFPPFKLYEVFENEDRSQNSSSVTSIRPSRPRFLPKKSPSPIQDCQGAQNPIRSSTRFLEMRIGVRTRPRLPQSDLLVLAFFRKNSSSPIQDCQGAQNPIRSSTRFLEIRIQLGALRGFWK